MKDLELSQLLTKAEELKALFILGQRVIPFLEEIFMFVNEIKPLLDEINVSIKDNLKKMPNASKQLSKVTEANELATTEIMDIVDGLLYKSNIISSNLGKLDEINKHSLNNPSTIIRMIAQAVEKSDDEILSNDLKNAILDYKTGNETEFQNTYDKTNEIIESIKDDSNSIMMSLQVQDITSQQIAAVNNLLQTVQGKLTQIMDKFENSDIGDLVGGTTIDSSKHSSGANISKLHRDIAFDPDAVESISQKEFRQSNVDELINSFDPDNIQNDEEINEPAAPHNGMDNMAAANSAPSAKVTNSTEEVSAKTEQKQVAQPIATEEAEDDFSNFSQDDIDALFGK